MGRPWDANQEIRFIRPYGELPNQSLTAETRGGTDTKSWTHIMYLLIQVSKYIQVEQYFPTQMIWPRENISEILKLYDSRETKLQNLNVFACGRQKHS